MSSKRPREDDDTTQSLFSDLDPEPPPTVTFCTIPCEMWGAPLSSGMAHTM